MGWKSLLSINKQPILMHLVQEKRKKRNSLNVLQISQLIFRKLLEIAN